MLDVRDLERAIGVARSVARLRLTDGFATGFLVSPRLLLTNHHVLPSTADAAGARAEFDYQEDASGALLPVQSFRLEPDRFFFSSVPLDFCLVSVAPASDRGAPLHQYGWLKLRDESKAEVGGYVNIVHHPRGGLKEIVLRQNDLLSLDPECLYYGADGTHPVSSGAPCFNDHWEVIALQHSGVPRLDTAGRMLRNDGMVWKQDVDDVERIDWIANVGIRVNPIVAALKSQNEGTISPQWIEELLDAGPPNPLELELRAPTSAGKPPSAPTRSKVFISYSHEDRAWLDELRISLKPYFGDTTLVFDDSMIQVGQKWKDEIEENIKAARAAVLIVTRNFEASDFIKNYELPPLLEAASRDELAILWMAAGFISERFILRTYQALNNPERPLNSLSDWERDAAMVGIGKQIAKVMDDSRQKSS